MFTLLISLSLQLRFALMSPKKVPLVAQRASRQEIRRRKGGQMIYFRHQTVIYSQHTQNYRDIIWPTSIVPKLGTTIIIIIIMIEICTIYNHPTRFPKTYRSIRNTWWAICCAFKDLKMNGLKPTTALRLPVQIAKMVKGEKALDILAKSFQELLRILLSVLGHLLFVFLLRQANLYYLTILPRKSLWMVSCGAVQSCESHSFRV